MVPRLIGLYSSAPRSGKSTAADIMWQRHGFKIKSFARPLKGMVEGLLVSFGFDKCEIDDFAENRKEEPIPAVGKSYRELCQTLGTEWGRNLIHSDIWVKAALGGTRNSGRVVFDDVRFPNEAEAILERGGQVWNVVREGASVASRHASDGALEGFPFRRTLVNGGSIDALAAEVWQALHD